jgi:hypothetical protein
MTVAELHSVLGQMMGENHDVADLTVYLNGYEGGLVDVTPTQIYVGKVVRDQRDSDWMGPHEEVQAWWQEEDWNAGAITDGLILSRSLKT